jgi:hypothetical protein
MISVSLSIRPQTFTLQLKLPIKEPTMSNEFLSDYDYELYIQAVLEDLDHACVPDEDDCNHYYSGEPVSQEEVEAELKEAFEYLVNNAK